MPNLTKNELLDYLAEVGKKDWIVSLKPNEFTRKDLTDRGLTTRRAETMLKNLLGEEKVTVQVKVYKGRTTRIYTWAGKVQK